MPVTTIGSLMRQDALDTEHLAGQQQARDMQKLQMMLTLKKLKEEADMKQQTGTMLKDLYRPEQPANPGTMGHGLGMGNPNAQPQLKQLMEQGGDFGMDNLSAINSSAEFSNKGAPVPMMAPQAAQAGGIDPMQLAAGFERMAATTGNVDFLTKAQEIREKLRKEGPKYHVVGGALVPEPAMPGQQTAPVYKAPEKAKDSWSEPYQMGGAMVQKNEATGEIRQAVSRPPVTNNVVNLPKGYNKLSELDAERISKAGEGYDQAKKSLITLDRMEKNQDGAYSGMFAPGKTELARFFRAAGVNDPKMVATLNNSQLFGQASEEYAASMLKALMGSNQLSNADLSMVRSLAPKLDQEPEARKQLIKYAKKRVSQMKTDYESMRQHFDKNDASLSGWQPPEYPDDAPDQPAQPKRQELSAPPPASQYPGKIMTTPEGAKFKSDGKKWVRQ